MGVGKRSSERALQIVLGQGANVNEANPLEVHDPKVGSLISYEGTTTADGAGDGSTLIDSVLTTKPDFNGNLVIVTSGAYAGQARDINGVTTGGTVTPHLAFGGQILRGTNFVIAAIRLTPAEVAALTALVVALMADVGDPTGETLPSLATKWGDIARSLDLILGARWDAGGDLGTDIVALLAGIVDIAAIEAKLDHASHGLAALKALIDAVEGKLDDGTTGLAALKALIDALEAKLDDGTTGLAALKTLIDAVEGKLDDGTSGLAALKALIDAIEAKLDTQKGATGIFYEQADVAINTTAPNDAETNIFHLSAASTRYIVRSLRLKCADPGANTVTVRLYELVNDGLTEVDSFAIDATNFGTYHSLMDMFGLPHLAGDELKVTVRASAGGPYAVTGQYSHGKTNN